MSANNRGINRLARALDARMAKHAAHPDMMELGTIQSDGKLLADSYSVAMSDYLTCDGYTPAPGDRVLISWINQGRDVVVIDKVVG
jgi:hypothetical protein